MANKPGAGRTFWREENEKGKAGFTRNGKPGCKNYRIKRFAARGAAALGWLPLLPDRAVILDPPCCFYRNVAGTGLNRPDTVSP